MMSDCHGLVSQEERNETRERTKRGKNQVEVTLVLIVRSCHSDKDQCAQPLKAFLVVGLGYRRVEKREGAIIGFYLGHRKTSDIEIHKILCLQRLSVTYEQWRDADSNITE